MNCSNKDFCSLPGKASFGQRGGIFKLLTFTRVSLLQAEGERTNLKQFPASAARTPFDFGMPILMPKRRG